MVKFSERTIKCEQCGKHFLAKDKFNHNLNKHSDFLEIKTTGCVIAVKEEVSSPDFACGFCLVDGKLKWIKTNQNMRYHQSKHHRGETMSKTKSELKDLLRGLTSCDDESCDDDNDDGVDDDDDDDGDEHVNNSHAFDDDDNGNDHNNDCCGNDNCRRLLSMSQQENERLRNEIDLLKTQTIKQNEENLLLQNKLASIQASTPIVMDSTQPEPIIQPAFDSISPVEARKINDVESLISMIDSGSYELCDLVKKREEMLSSYNLMPVQTQLISDSNSSLPTSSVPGIIKALAWINVLTPHTMTNPFKVFDVGSGGGKSGHCFAILTEGLAKVLGFEIKEKDCYFSMRDSGVCNRYLPDNKRMETQFLAFNEDILNVSSADGFNVMFCQVRAMNPEPYQNIAKCYNNSNVEVLLVACATSWKCFEAGVIDSGGIRGELVGQYTTTCFGGKTSTTFRVYRKTPIPQEWTTDVVMLKYVDALDNLTIASYENHLNELSKKFVKRKRKKPDILTITWKK